MTEETLFHEALARIPAERAAFLESACVGQPELRAAVEALLAAHEASQNPLDRPVDLEQTVDSLPPPPNSDVTEVLSAAGQVPAQRPTSAPSETPPPADNLIAGRYQLVQKIGEGGMGEVWVAQQVAPVKRKVALKLIRAGMDSAAVLARFEQERQALALMDHPNIARVLDGGVTPTGQPFFVMELVNGLPLTQFCDEARLPPRDRLELFVAICQAVQHAHQKGIVHRDLKPANILVTLIDGRPVPRVIDFGVAKATGGNLLEEAVSTNFGSIVGTLEYMSPEQAGYSGVDVDTRADIYSLGVILYELLTGLRPIDVKRMKKAAILEMIRVIQEEEPERPSTRLSTDQSLPSLAALRQTQPHKLMALLKGELDWIIMKCLEKSRDRRYDTATSLASDVHRYLSNEPVEARPPSLGYRLQKLVQRNRAAVFAGLAVALALLLGTVVATWQAIRATQAETQEREARKQATDLAEANANLANQEREAKDLALVAKNQALEAKAQQAIQLERARGSLFTTQMTRVAAVRDTDPAQALELLHDLNACPVDLRDAAWRFSERLATRRTITSFKHRAESLAISPDGQLLALSSTETERPMFNPANPPPFGPGFRPVFKHTGRVTILELPSGNVKAVLPPVPDGVAGLTFSPDSKKLIYSSGSPPRYELDAEPKPGVVHLWDVEQAREVQTFQGHKDLVLSLCFHPDGGTLATGSKDSTIKTWDVATGKERETLAGHTRGVTAVRFHPEGKQLASGGLDNTIRLWDVTEKKPLRTLTATVNDDAEFTSFVKNFGERRRVAAGGDYNGAFLNAVISLSFSPDGKRLVSGNANWLIETWDVATGQSRLVIREERSPIQVIQYHPNGRSFFSSEFMKTKRWDASTGQLLLTLDRAGEMSLNGDGSRLATTFPGLVEILDVDTPVPLATFKQEKVKGNATRVVFSGSGETLAVACGEKVYLWDIQSGKVRHILEGHKQPIHGLALAPDGRTLATSGQFQRGVEDPEGGPAPDDVRLWDLTTGESLGALELGEAEIPDVAFHPDGRVLATITESRDMNPQNKVAQVTLWDTRTRKRIEDLKETLPAGFAALGRSTVLFTPDGKRLVAGAGRTIRIWDATERKLERTLEISGGTFSGIASLAMTPDSKKLAGVVSQGSSPPAVQFWDVGTGAQLQKSPGNSGQVLITPNGKSFVTRGIQFGDVLTGQVQDTYRTDGSLAISPDGTLVATALSSSRILNLPTEGTLEVNFWDLGPPRALAFFSGPTYTGEFSPDGNTLAIWQRTPGEPVQLWDLNPFQPRATIGSSQHDSICKAFSPSGQIMALAGASGSDPLNRLRAEGDAEKPGQLSFWDTQTGKLQKTLEVGQGVIQAMAYTDDGKTLALIHSVRDPMTRREVGTVDLFDTSSEKVRQSFPRPDRHGRACAFSQDGQVLALGCLDGTIILRDLASEKDSASWKATQGMINSLRFSRDGTRLICMAQEGPVEKCTFWDWKTKKLHPGDLSTEQETRNQSPDGRYELDRTPRGLQLLDRKVQQPLLSRKRP